MLKSDSEDVMELLKLKKTQIKGDIATSTVVPH